MLHEVLPEKTSPILRRAPRVRPKVFIVTPSYNQGPFLRATIESVLAQDYESVDYFVADGGSNDESVDILESYGERLRWRSAPDGGQSAAIAEAWSRTDADVVAWLNSDDVYEPGAISTAVRHLKERPDVAVLYGKAWYVDRAGTKIGTYPTRPFDAGELFHKCYICQPATFLRRRVFEAETLPDPTLRYCMDYDLWIRLARRYRFAYLEEYLASARVYAETKTVGERDGVFQEIFEVTRRHFGETSRNWTVAHALHRSEKTAESAGRLLPERWRRRLEAMLVRRAEARIEGPLYADRWAGSRTRIEIEPNANGRVRFVCEAPFWPHRRPLEISVTDNGRVIERKRVTEEHFSIDVYLPERSQQRVALVLSASDTFIPLDHGLGPDLRPLSFMVRVIEPDAASTNAASTNTASTERS